jgi:anthraniloyl-CoA monooxygenase
VFKAVRAAWPEGQADVGAHLGARLGRGRHHAGRRGGDRRAFKAAGADLIDCSSGQVSAQQKPVYGRMYQTPFADRVRQEAGIATIAVGAISEADHVNSIIAAGRADLCAVAARTWPTRPGR